MPADPPKQNRRSRLLTGAALAFVFLGMGAAGGGFALLIANGTISFSPPEQTRPVAEEKPPLQNGADTIHENAATSRDQKPETSASADPVPAGNAPDDLDAPADPFYDMAQSAVIPLAGDPVLLRSGSTQNRIELSERFVTSTAGSGQADHIPTSTAFVLDSQMLDDKGDLVIRAPGSEADFQFANFGGGEDAGALDVNETVPADQDSELPVFLRPSTDTLNLYLSERAIGQGGGRIDLQEEVGKPVDMKSFLVDRSFDETSVGQLAEFMAAEFGKTGLAAGDKIAVRGVRMANRIGRIGDYYQPVQLSLYSADGYVGTAALSTSRGGDPYVRGADPWFGKAIGVKETRQDKPGGAVKTHRLIDGLYATAVRNAVPASIVGEAIAYLAPMTDLKRAVRPDERFTLLFAGVPRDEKRGGGKVLFAGIRRGDNWSVRCYVLKAPGNRGFACVNEGGKLSLSGAMLVPVKGVLTSKFGMRFHPIKKTERLHAGVDWAAPTGTPVRAAFSGKVTYRNVRGGYGNFIELTHKDGISSRYAHLHEYGDGIELGSVVQAGDLIGYVGTTGLSTGPHLHFEIRQRGEPTDPLAFEMETGTDAPQTVAGGTLKAYRATIGTILAGR